MGLNRIFGLNLTLKSWSIGYFACNSIRALGALGGFLIALFSVQYGSASEYGYFLFAMSVVGFLPDFISSLVVAEYLNLFTRSLNQPHALIQSSVSSCGRYQELFNWFFISCFVSFGLGCLVPAFHSTYGLLVLVTAVACVYFRQRLTIFSEKLKLSFPAYIGDFLLFVAPQILVILFLNALHYFKPGTTLNALQIALSSALPYFFIFVLCGLNSRCKSHLVEDIFGLRRAVQLLLGVRSPSGFALANKLSFATSLSYCSIRLPGLFLGFSSAQISSVAVYGILQRIQYLISIPGYSFISWNARRLASEVSTKSKKSVFSLGLGMLFASVASPVAFLVLYFKYRQSVGWLFSKNGFGFEVSPLLLLVVMAATSLLVFQAFVANALTASSKFQLLLGSQAFRLLMTSIGFVLLILANKVSVGAIFAIEFTSIVFSLSFVLFAFIPKK